MNTIFRILSIASVLGVASGGGAFAQPVANLGPSSHDVIATVGFPNDSYNDGDPHLTTVDGVHYEFQGAGEFVALRDGAGMQIQTRQTGVTTATPYTSPHSGLTTCVAVNTALAARVGTHRVTYQPSGSGAAGMQLRVDGAVVATPGVSGVTLGSGGRVASNVASGINIDFPDGTSMSAFPNYWAAQSVYYLNISVFHTPATEGLMGAMAPGSWLPALPNGSSLGPAPATMHQRFVDLQQTFANAWRVTAATSLFDYASGTSTATFNFPGYPPENPPCVFPKSPPAKPLDRNTAQRMCHDVIDKNRNANCVFDVAVTGEQGFVKAYVISERLEAGATRTNLTDDKDTSPVGGPVRFTATVKREASSSGGVPVGAVQFSVDGARASDPVKLDAEGRATWTTSRLSAGKHNVSARYLPTESSVFLTSTSFDKVHAVIRGGGGPARTE
ncbi:MAG TPA: Ig-like domain-containing protein [Candidatus Elarobacter sp.]|nr:Ig-like domain-containing protein [Candidatus Elarobacter sp.]